MQVHVYDVMFALMFFLTSPPPPFITSLPPLPHSSQDLYLDCLTFQVHDLEEQLALSDVQCSAQAQETKAMKESLTDATMEVEVCAYVEVVCVCVCVCVCVRVCVCVCVHV